ncbi:MAG: aminotransferase [Beijerinckiaceae bacterium]
MTPPINPRLLDTATPPIPEARAWISHYGGAHGPLIDLSQAAPAVVPPQEMLHRLAAAASDPASAKYGPIEGDLALREAYARDVAETYDATNIGLDEIAITAGCNQAFMVAAMALAKAGDAVLLPSPWYFNHKMALDMLGIEARPLLCTAERGFVPDPAEAERMFDSRTRAIVLVTPNNPTGAIYPPHVIAAFAGLARERNIWLVIDETYRDFMPDGVDRAHDLFVDGGRDRVIQLYSFSKSYAVPGYRLGAILGPPELMRQIAKILDTLQICPARVGQVATSWAIGALRAWRDDNRVDINARAAAFADAMNNAPGWRIDSIGAYFAFVRGPYPGAATETVERLAVGRGVLALPGAWFGPGGEGHLRVAFANAPMEMLGEIPARIAGVAQ